MNTTPIREVRRIRKFIIAHPEMSPKNLYYACDTNISKAAFRGIFDNRHFTDTSYTRPPRRLEAQSHPWANEMFVCAVCGDNKAGTEYYVKRNKEKAYRIHTCRVCYLSRKYCGMLGSLKKAVGRPRKAVVPTPKIVKPKRPASIDCKFTCSVCGFGSNEESEVLACCSPMKR